MNKTVIPIPQFTPGPQENLLGLLGNLKNDKSGSKADLYYFVGKDSAGFIVRWGNEPCEAALIPVARILEPIAMQLEYMQVAGAIGLSCVAALVDKAHLDPETAARIQALSEAAKNVKSFSA